MIADLPSNKKLNPIVTELFIRGGKVNISLVFITQSYFAVPKDIRLNFTHYSIMEIHLIKHQILIYKTLCIYIKNLMQNHSYSCIR